MTARRSLVGFVSEGAGSTGAEARDGIDPLEEELALPFDEEPWGEGLTLFHAAGVRVEPSRLVEHDSGDVSYPRGARVVCETAAGVAWGEVVVPSRRISLPGPLPRILRRATAEDKVAEAKARERERAVCKVVADAARSLDLPVKVVRAEAGGGKLAVYFASDSRVSFRDWLRAIGRATGERVELRQIGMRDAARILGGVGPCGLQLCCNTFLAEFAPVGIKAARTQGLTLNPQKVSGMCGRLLCCLVYEEAQYREGRRAMVEPGDAVDTEHGRGRVRDVDVLAMRVAVTLEGGETRSFDAADVTRRRVE